MPEDNISPPALSSGDTIGVVAPARWLEPEKLEAAKAVLEEAGFRVRLHDQNGLRDGQLAGTDTERAAALMEMAADPDIKAVMCARGGYGALRIVDGLDYGVIAANPKIYVGYSDITCLLWAIRQNTGMATLHGPMMVDLAGNLDGESRNHLAATLTGDDPWANAPGLSSLRTMRPGSGEGPLVGGNLTILANMIGTAGDFDTAGAVLFIEDVDEYLYNIDRMLLHLKRAGRLDDLAALVLGSFTDMKDHEVPFGRDVEQMVMEHCAHGGYPIVAGFPCGHGDTNLALPVGIAARIEAGIKARSEAGSKAGADGSTAFSVKEKLAI